MDIVETIGRILKEMQLLIGALFGAWLSWVVWSRQFRKQHRFSVVQETARALGLFYEDATNQKVLAEQEDQLKEGKKVREVMMRPETSSALATQTLMVKAVFGDELEEELRKVSAFNPKTDPTGNKFVGRASDLLKKLIDKV